MEVAESVLGRERIGPTEPEFFPEFLNPFETELRGSFCGEWYNLIVISIIPVLIETGFEVSRIQGFKVSNSMPFT